MYRKLLALGFSLIATASAAQAVRYPETLRGDVVDVLAGERVVDKYRWLENDVRVDPRVKAWVDAQNAVTQAYLAGLPQRDAIEERLRTLWDYERFGVPKKAGNRRFFLRNSGLQNQSALFVQEGSGGEARVLIDPNGWAVDGATALAEWTPSKDGSRLAYAVQDGGTDWRIIRIMDVATGTAIGEELRWAKYSGDVAWTKDGSGFYYSRFPAPKSGEEYQSLNIDNAVWFHRVGTAQSADEKVYATPDRPKLTHSAEVTDDGRWLVITSAEGTDDRYEVTVKDLSKPNPKSFTLIRGLEHSWAVAGTDGDRILFVTNKDAPRYRIVSIAPAAGIGSMREVVAERDAVLDGASRVGNRIIASYMEDAKDVVRSFDLAGRDERPVTLPGIGSVSGFDGDADDSETFYSFTSFNYPTTIFRFDAATGKSEVYRQPKTAVDPKRYEVTQQFYRSKDGTRVPMFVVRKAGTTQPAPLLLYGYGGFNVSLTPAFSVNRIAWLDMGGIYVVANLRGGGEYGKAWHDAGRLLKKQNVFDDFIAAAEHLIATGMTTRDQLAIEGRSNGGLLVGAVVNQRPDLFAAALPGVGVMDMLRYNQFTAGRYWVDDYGDPNDGDYFRYLRNYSPYHNVRSGKDYPAILVTTADTDDRVVPGHSFKYTAELQAANTGDKPHLIRIETRAGHGSGKPTDKIIEEAADSLAFIGYWTGLTRTGAKPAVAGQ